MEQKPKKPVQAVHISWDLFSRLMTLRGKLATPENKLKLKDMVNEAITKYLEESKNDKRRTKTKGH
jgi:hypothetical protein